MRDAKNDSHGCEMHGWIEHIQGAAGELAFAKCIGAYWNGSINKYGVGADVEDFDVRTRTEHDWCLIVRQNAPDDLKCVLVVGHAPILRVVGWMVASAAKQKQWLTTFTPGRELAYFVPQSALHPISTLPRREHA